MADPTLPFPAAGLPAGSAADPAPYGRNIRAIREAATAALQPA